jgi:FtsP/CotA-like multicopper oxidase with cupredoxin domain
MIRWDVPAILAFAGAWLAASAPLAAQQRTVELNLTADVQQLSLVPGTETEVFAYNGTVPGPVIELREGDRVTVHFHNKLPVATTVHWHGLQIPFDADGSPFHPVAPGERHDYTFTILPGTAGTYWYHPHPHHHTGYQVGKGLYGAIIVRAADDPLPKGLKEQLLVIADNRFKADGSLDVPDPSSMQARIDFENGREGDVIFVNGVIHPTLAIHSGETQRWRIVNASAARVYRLAIPGHKLLQVGSDGGLFERPVEVEEIILANGERAEVLVQGSAEPGMKTSLVALPYDRYIKQTKPKNWDATRELLTLQYSDAVPMKSAALPSVLRVVPAIDTTTVTATRVISFSQGMINGKLHDMDRVDMSTQLGATEIWEIENLVGMDHPFHLHGFQFQLLDRNGVPEKFRSWKDTVNVPKHSTARFIVKYENHPGKWMFHCHILAHEDNGMMGVLEVR